MAYIFSQITKYVITLAFLMYTFECFHVFRFKNDNMRSGIYLRQNIIMVIIHFLSMFTLFVKELDASYLLMFLLEEAVVIIAIIAYSKLYKNASRLLINNMCMLLLIGLIIIGRVSPAKSKRQFMIMTFGLAATIFIPMLIKKLNHLEKLKWIYVIAGIVSLSAVLVFSQAVYGSKINITIMNLTFQPSEYVKIIFVFAIASLLYNRPNNRDVIISAAIAGVHVLLLVLSKDLGSAVIFFFVYFSMIFVATRNVLYYLFGLLSGSVAAVIGYFLFSHVRVRVIAFLDPFGTIENAGYQIAQSLFAIGTGSWFGMGLSQGAPGTIPVVTADFIFAAIVEEMGIIFGICLILVCLSCFMMFLNIAMKFDDMFHKLIAVGLSVAYGFQVFLTIGGVTKFIPLTGVTLPLVSYGGTSILVTLCVFAIIQGLYISRGAIKAPSSETIPAKTTFNKAAYKNAEQVVKNRPHRDHKIRKALRQNDFDIEELDEIDNLRDLEKRIINETALTKVLPDEEDISFNMAVEEGLRLAGENTDDYKLDSLDLFDVDYKD